MPSLFGNAIAIPFQSTDLHSISLVIDISILVYMHISSLQREWCHHISFEHFEMTTILFICIYRYIYSVVCISLFRKQCFGSVERRHADPAQLCDGHDRLGRHPATQLGLPVWPDLVCSSFRSGKIQFCPAKYFRSSLSIPPKEFSFSLSWISISTLYMFSQSLRVS